MARAELRPGRGDQFILRAINGGDLNAKRVSDDGVYGVSMVTYKFVVVRVGVYVWYGWWVVA